MASRKSARVTKSVPNNDDSPKKKTAKTIPIKGGTVKKKTVPEKKIAPEKKIKTVNSKVDNVRVVNGRSTAKVQRTKRKALLSVDDFLPKTVGDCVLSCGNGEMAQLGLGEDVEQCKVPRVVKSLASEKILQVTAGGLHSVVLTASHKVLTCGCNDEAALGRLCFDDELKIRDDDQDYSFRPVTFPEGTEATHGPMVMVCAGDTHTAALTKNGSVFIWGMFRDKAGALGISVNDQNNAVIAKINDPYLLWSFKRGVIVKIASGSSHIVMLSENGEIFTIGAGGAGQLGRLGPQFRDSTTSTRTARQMLTPRKVIKLSKRKNVVFTDVWCAGYCNFAQSTDGQIYIWGLNNYGQLGVKADTTDTFDLHVPTISQQFTSAQEWKMFAGDHHVLAVDSKGNVHGVGRANDYKLATSGDVQESVIKIPGTEGNAVGVSANTASSFFWNRSGKAYSWGLNIAGELGVGAQDDEVVKEPRLLNMKNAPDVKILQISVGGQHTIMLGKNSN